MNQIRRWGLAWCVHAGHWKKVILDWCGCSVAHIAALPTKLNMVRLDVICEDIWCIGYFFHSGVADVTLLFRNEVYVLQLSQTQLHSCDAGRPAHHRWWRHYVRWDQVSASFPKSELKYDVKGPWIPYKLEMFIPWGKSNKSPAPSLTDDHKAIRFFKQEASKRAVDDGPVHASPLWDSGCHNSIFFLKEPKGSWTLVELCVYHWAHDPFFLKRCYLDFKK